MDRNHQDERKQPEESVQNRGSLQTNISKYASNYQQQKYHNIGYKNTNSYLVINSCGIYDGYFPNLSVNRQRGREDYYFLYNELGVIKVRTAQGVKQILPGSILTFRPKEKQVYRYDEAEYSKNYWIHFTGYGAQEILDLLGITNGIPITVGYIPDIEKITEDIIMEMKRCRPAYNLHITALFMLMVGKVYRHLKENRPSHMSKRSSQVYQSLQYIQQNIDQNIKVSELAKMSFLSINRYTDIFADLLGITPKQYILTQKIQKAKELLSTTDSNIGEVAASVGYTDPLYFSRIFKQFEGISPSDFKKIIRC